MPHPDVPEPDLRADLAAYLARVKHDLGKYVAFQQRWLPAGAPAHERREAVFADLRETRRGPEGTLDAVALWAALRPPLVGAATLPGGGRVDLSHDPDVVRIDRAVDAIARVLDGVAEGEDRLVLEVGAAAALEVSDACAALVRRFRPRSS